MKVLIEQQFYDYKICMTIDRYQLLRTHYLHYTDFISMAKLALLTGVGNNSL